MQELCDVNISTNICLMNVHQVKCPVCESARHECHTDKTKLRVYCHRFLRRILGMEISFRKIKNKSYTCHRPEYSIVLKAILPVGQDPTKTC